MASYKMNNHLVASVSAQHAHVFEEVTSSCSSLSSTQHLLQSDLTAGHCNKASSKSYKTLQSSNASADKLGESQDVNNTNRKYQFEIEKKTSQNASLTYHVVKNMMVLGCTFTLVFTCFVSLQSLQSTLNGEQGLGVLSLSCLYGATIISCFISPYLIVRLTTKWTVVLGYCLFLVYVACNFYPRLYVMVPASLLLGVLTGPLWSAQSTYLTTLAIHYAHRSHQMQDVTINKFNGIFSSVLQTSYVWGNLLSSAILSADNHTVHASDHSINHSLTRYQCGAHNCRSDDEPVFLSDDHLPDHSDSLPSSSRTILLSLLLCATFLAILIMAAFLDSNGINMTNGARSLSTSSSRGTFLDTINMLRDPTLQLVSPLVVYTGIEQGFILGDFTKAYVNCTLGIHNIGYVLMCYGAVNSLTSLAIAGMGQHIKRHHIMISGSLFNAGILLVLLLWRPDKHDRPMFYIVASCLGLCEAIWQTQTNTLFGVLFVDNLEAAFSCYRVFQALGMAVAFAYSHFLCVSTKVYIIGGVLIVALVFYGAVEYRLHQNKFRAGIFVL